MSESAVIYITTPKPSDIQWLHPDDARAVGIEFAMLPNGRGEEQERLERGGGGGATTPARTPETAAARYADFFFAHWSESNEAALRFFEHVYSPSINFRGTPISRAEVMDEKRRYVERWPTRVYLVRPAACGPTARAARACARSQAKSLGIAGARTDGRKRSASPPSPIQLTIGENGDVQVAGEWGDVVARSPPT